MSTLDDYENDPYTKKIIDQMRVKNSFRYPEVIYVPFIKRTLINKIKSVYWYFRYLI
uniref:Uncharacterized protein n=1 Tax=viral metagenome TaxID=1070528 RepID=A0A6H1ZLR1_9ZZZZ